jgi:lecithin-cholesterol acyltransferase
MDPFSMFPYVHKLFTQLEQNGYKGGINLHSATVNFRFGTHEQILDGEFEKIKKLIEQTAIRNNKKVHLIGHSYGANLANFFLSDYVNSQWKDRYIKSFIPIGNIFKL